jgi:branched-chain amino acid transport system permease protein
MTASSPWRGALPRLAGGLALILLPLVVSNQYHLHLASLIGAFWILVAGLNLVVGYTGQLSVGHVGLLAIGSYTFAILAGKHGWDPILTTVVAGLVCGLCGFLVGLPSLRLPEFYFAMSTLAFGLIVTELAVARTELTGGGVGLPAPFFPGPLGTPSGFYWLILVAAGLVTWLTWNVTRFMWGRSLVAIRDSPVAAASVGVPVFRAKLTVFVFSGVTAGVAGALFSSLQSYITPDTFHFELSLFFFVSIIIGGRGSILGPFVGTAVLTALPELVAPLAKLGTFFYGLLLLLVVLLVPEGVGRLVQRVMAALRPPVVEHHAIRPDLDRLRAALRAGARR